MTQGPWPFGRTASRVTKPRPFLKSATEVKRVWRDVADAPFSPAGAAGLGAEPAMHARTSAAIGTVHCLAKRAAAARDLGRPSFAARGTDDSPRVLVMITSRVTDRDDRTRTSSVRRPSTSRASSAGAARSVHVMADSPAATRAP